MGVRQLRHPLQGVRPGGRAAHAAGEDRRCRAGAPVHRRRADRGAAHPMGPGRRLRRAGRLRPRPGRGDRRHQRQRLPGRRLQARQRHQPRPGRAEEGPGASAGVRRHHGRHGVARPEAMVRRRHELPGPGRHPRPPGPPRRGPGRRVRAAGRAPALPAGVQALRAGVLQHRRAGLGHRLRPLREARPEGAGRRRHRAPRAGNQHRVHRRVPAAGGQARRIRLQLPVLRRRRPDGRRRRPVPALPHHARGRAGRRVRRARRVHARPVPQHRAEDPRPDPLGDERPGGHRQGAPRRRRGAAGGAVGR